MSLGRSLLVTAGIAGAFALGVWARPHLNIDSNPVVAERNGADMAPTAAADPRAAEAQRLAAPTTTARTERAPVSAMSTELHQKLQPLLNRGTKMAIAAGGFTSGEQFATVAHVSRNLDIPFMVLKDRVVTQRKSLVAAIRELKPLANALREAEKARAEAKEDVADIQQ